MAGCWLRSVPQHLQRSASRQFYQEHFLARKLQIAKKTADYVQVHGYGAVPVPSKVLYLHTGHNSKDGAKESKFTVRSVSRAKGAVASHLSGA